MAVTKDDVRAIAPEFSAPGTPDATVNAFLADAAIYFGTTNMGGERADFIQKWGTAHLLALAGQGSNGGRGLVVSERVGEVARTFAAPNKGAKLGDLESTRYGQVLARFLRKTGVHAVVVP